MPVLRLMFAQRHDSTANGPWQGNSKLYTKTGETSPPQKVYTSEWNVHMRICAIYVNLNLRTLRRGPGARDVNTRAMCDLSP